MKNGNGKGKEYYNNGKLIFDGKYSYGRKWTGNMYDPFGNFIYKINNGNLTFEGGFFNGMKWNGKGKEYDHNNK